MDTIAPSVRLDAPVETSSTNDTTPTFAGSGDVATGDSTNVTVKLYAGTSASGTPTQTLSTTRGGGGSFSIDSSALAEGTYTARAEQADAAGNTGLSSATTFNLPPESSSPTIVALPP